MNSKMINLVIWSFFLRQEILNFIEALLMSLNYATSDSGSLQKSISDLFLCSVAITSKLERVDLGSLGQFTWNVPLNKRI